MFLKSWLSQTRSYGWAQTQYEEGNGNRLQYSCLENPMNRGAWWATVHEVTKSRTLSDWAHKPRMTGVLRRKGDIRTQRGACEDTEGKVSASQEDRPRKEPSLGIPWSQTSGLQNLETLNSCCFSHPVCGALLWQLQQTNTNLMILYFMFIHTWYKLFAKINKAQWPTELLCQAISLLKIRE